MSALMLLEHVFGSWSMMSFPMPWKRRLAVPSGCRMSSSRPSMMTSWSVWAMQRRPIRIVGSADEVEVELRVAASRMERERLREAVDVFLERVRRRLLRIPGI